MNKETSTYLDLARFLAAFTVMLCHIDEYVVKAVTPFADHLGIEAVGVFFVLSGFVIGFATEFREKGLRSYSINRAARLYSVVIPCLIATLLLDTFGKHYLHDVYYSHDSFAAEAIRIVFSFSFLNYSWLLPYAILPGTDGPFWSLCYEVPYYILFGAIWYLRGFWRWLIPILYLGLMGPRILTFFPLWVLGFGLYHLFRAVALNRQPARWLLAASVLLWAVFEGALAYFDVCPDVTADIAAGPLLIYGAGLCFAVSVIGFRFSEISLGSIAKPVHWLAGATFTLYLLHFPLVWVLNGTMLLTPMRSWPELLRWALLVAATFSLALAMAQVTERQKQVWRRGIERIFDIPERLFKGGGKAELEKAN